MQTNTLTLSGTAAALGKITGVRGKSVAFNYTSSGTETVSVTGILTGSITTTNKLRFIDTLTQAAFASGDMTKDGCYKMENCPFDELVFLASGSSDAKVVSIVAWSPITG